jgi:predicted DNA-binding transcriptional regulator YafY
MRADRLLSIVLLLQAHGRLTAGELSKRLEVSRRTIYRDMEVLSGAGIPVAAERGTGGGWFLLDTYQTKLTGLNPTEIQALFLPKPDHVLSDLGLHQASEAALVKLLASLPAMYRDNAELTRQRIHIDATGYHHHDEDISFLPIIQQAVWQERRLQLVYHLSTGPIIESVLDPLGLVAKGSVWYLVAGYDDRIGVYRISRVQDARITDEPSHRPKDFDLAAYWQASAEQYLANRPRYPVTLRVAPAIRAEICDESCMPVEDIATPDEEGWTRVRIEFETEDGACWYVLYYGASIEVLEPLALRERVAERAREIVDLYERQIA